jgi:coenzyme F420 hydrogenase subunit beta
MSQTARPFLREKVELAIGFFCAGTPSSRGTLKLLEKCELAPERLTAFRYRGMGWPGHASAWEAGEERPCLQMSYKESWGFVQKFRPFRCYLCPDLTAEFADISVGDPWYREVSDSDPGQSLILVRTETGRRIFRTAREKGYVNAVRVSPEILSRSQANLLGKRQAIWGRILAMKALGIPHPELGGFHLFENWKDLSLADKARSFIGTAKRIAKRDYFKPIDYNRP